MGPLSAPRPDRSEPLAPPGLPSQTGRQHDHRIRSPQTTHTSSDRPFAITGTRSTSRSGRCPATTPWSRP